MNNFSIYKGFMVQPVPDPREIAPPKFQILKKGDS